MISLTLSFCFFYLVLGQKIVLNLSPFNSKDFKSRGLADRIKDLPSLVALYPDIPKHQAFGKYYTQGKVYVYKCMYKVYV